MKKTAEEKEKFINAFEKEYGHKVVSFELAELKASSAVFNVLKLRPQENTDFIWGLVVFCKGGIYFYSFAQDNFLSFYVRKSTGAEEDVAQCIALSRLNCTFKIPDRHFLDFLFPRKKHIIKACFTDENKNSCSLELYMNKKATDVINYFTISL